MLKPDECRRFVQALLFLVCATALGAEAAAQEIRWANWGKGREVASGKMVKWTVNKNGHIYLNNARNGWGWTQCKQPNGFRALHVAAFGSKAYVSSDTGRVILYTKHPTKGACQMGRELRRTPVLVRDLAYDGTSLFMLGEDGEAYLHRDPNWTRHTFAGRPAPDAFNQSLKTNPGNVMCNPPRGKRHVLFVDRRHGSALMGGNRSQPGHKKVNHAKPGYDQDAVWILERLDAKQCLFRLRSHRSGKYLVAGDNYDAKMYMQPHKNRTNAIWRLVSGHGGSVSLVDYKHGRAITGGDKFDGRIYHQELTPVSARAKITGRENQWWYVYDADPLTYQPVKGVKGKEKCDLHTNKPYRFDDLKHRKSLRWKDGRHNWGHLQYQAEWYLQPAGKCAYFMLSKDRKTLIVAGDNYDGRFYTKPNTDAWRKRANSRWRFWASSPDAFAITDSKHYRQIVAGNNFDGNAYHQKWANRKNGLWRMMRVLGGGKAARIPVHGTGTPRDIGVQPMRLSGDPYFQRWWFSGSDNAVNIYDAKAKWQPFNFEALDVHVNDEGKPYVLSPGMKLYFPQSGTSAKRDWGNFKELTANAMRFDVDPLGYPIVIRHVGDNQISQTFPKRDGSVPGAGSCSSANPWSFLSSFAQNQFNKMTSGVAGLAKGVASGDFDAMVTNMAKVGAFSAGGGMFDQSAFLGAVLQTIPVSQIQTIGTITANFRQQGYQGFAQAVKGDAKELANTAKELGTAMSKGSFKGMGEAIINNPSVKFYLLGPIVETDWNQSPMLIAMQIRAKYAIRAYQLKSRVAKYTPAGAAKHMATAALVKAFEDHGPGFAKDILNKVKKLSKDEEKSIDKVLAIAVQGMDQEINAAAKGGVKPSPLYTEAVLKDAKAAFVWNDKGSGADSDGSFWRPKLDPGCISLGDLGQRGYNPPKMKQICNAAKGRGVWWDYPTGYEIIWSDRCSGADLDGSVWLPRCKPGYIAVGFVTNRASDHQPWRDRVACLKAGPNLATYRPMAKSQLNYTWNDKGSGAKQDVEILSRMFGGFPLMYAWPERKGLDHTRKTYHWSAIARIGDKAGAERALGLAKAGGPAKEYLND